VDKSKGWEGSTDGGESFTDRKTAGGASQVRVRPGTVHDRVLRVLRVCKRAL
jgi:hypothetical protein